MTGDERERRDSRALEPELIADPQARAVAEASNGFRQYDAAIAIIQNALERGSFKLRPSMILGLQREALAGISSYAGNYRSFGGGLGAGSRGLCYDPFSLGRFFDVFFSASFVVFRPLLRLRALPSSLNRRFLVLLLAYSFRVGGSS